MRKYLIAAAVLLAALPCAAELKDAPAAVAALKSAAAKDRLEAIYYLGAQRTQDAYAALADHFPVEKDAYLRVQLVEVLNVRGSTSAYSCAAAAAGDPNKAVRQAAASALAPNAGDAVADGKLGALAADSSEEVRLAVVTSLSADTSTSAVSIVGAVLSDRKSTLRARRTAAGVLSGLKTPGADRELLKHLSDADPEIKAAAAARKPARAKSGAVPGKPAKARSAPAPGKPAGTKPAPRG
ncbi:MAG: hypothetical protein Q7R35_01950 [Elusimicrobiota bacterium]|nr:hypothetical protein [Elusimicrobiota bacterium]